MPFWAAQAAALSMSHPGKPRLSWVLVLVLMVVLVFDGPLQPIRMYRFSGRRNPCHRGKRSWKFEAGRASIQFVFEVIEKKRAICIRRKSEGVLN
ncbi:MAG: hypothetical protein JO279_02020 [Verrucomicrobia bacterium]|nr:hypothetical protein [Verrucomicrobiota bacterium]